MQHLSVDSGLTPEQVAGELAVLTGRRHTPTAVLALRGVRLQPSRWKIRFANLVSGRFTELVFQRAFGHVLIELGLTFQEETVLRNFVDYRVSEPAEPFEIALNLKNAGVQYRDSQRWVGLSPEDTLPIATYKIFGSETAQVPPLIYVYLVDWTLLDRLRTGYWQILSGPERETFALLTSAKEMPRDIEDSFIEGTVGDRLDKLMAHVGYGEKDLSLLPFRAISAGRCRQLFYDRHERSPYVYRQRMNTDPNVHISVKEETMAFSDFVELYLSTRDGRRNLLAELRRTTQVNIPSPGV